MVLRHPRVKLPFVGTLLDSFTKNVFCKRVKPVPGSILRCDLAFRFNFGAGRAYHTGIYLGDDKVVEVTEQEQTAQVRIVSPAEFLNGESGVRTGAFIYVATSRGKVLGSPEIAARARAEATTSRGQYNLVFNNCHMFTRYCVTGEDSPLPLLTVEKLEESLRKTFGVRSVCWASTGFGCGDDSFDDLNYD